ncbi:hypothetical protein D1872_287090 [compost metagenome]
MVLHLVVGMKRTQMPRYMATQFVGDEVCHRFEVFIAVVFPLDQKCRHFDPDTGIYHTFERIFDRF